LLIDVFVGIVIDVVVVVVGGGGGGVGGVSGSVVVVSGSVSGGVSSTSTRWSSRWRCHHGRYFTSNGWTRCGELISTFSLLRQFSTRRSGRFDLLE